METSDSRFKISFSSARNIIAFFIFGLTNNFGYVIMLSAADDLLKRFDELSNTQSELLYQRQCHSSSTGAILLANIIPCTLIKFVAPFGPLWIHARMGLTVATTVVGLVLCAIGTSSFLIITGVVFVSFSCGLGETSLLTYMVFFKTSQSLSAWASGTGMAGLLGSFSYVVLRHWCGLSPETSIMCMLCMPILMAVCFWIVLERPFVAALTQEIKDDRVRESHYIPLKEKIRLSPHILIVYTTWYGLVYFFEYFINQGLFELLYFPNTFLNKANQYKWYNVLYQAGVFISRSSVNFIQFDRTWTMAFLQFINSIVFLCEVIFGYMHYMPIAMCIIFWEGLLGGSSYVNTYRRITAEIPQERREYSMALNAIGDSIMITLAGIVALPVHDAICDTKPPYS